jgi:hypothetical protein
LIIVYNRDRIPKVLQLTFSLAFLQYLDTTGAR